MNKPSTTMASTCLPANNTEDKWWARLVEEDEKQTCKRLNCKFAPTKHERHPALEYFSRNRRYCVQEEKLIIKYLFTYNEIHNGKGLKVWIEMHERGYLQHRSIESLNNHFKKILLNKIESFKLPNEVESKFLELRC